MHYAVTATAPGSAHINPGQPGKTSTQDAVVSIKLPQGRVVVLCDGCGSQPYSGTGADIGAHLIAQAVIKDLARALTPEKLDWTEITAEVGRTLHQAVRLFAPDDSSTTFERMTVERFLFTAMVLVVIDDVAVVASFGDGIIIIDEEIIEIEAPILNAPPYIGYLLLKDSSYHAEPLRKHLVFSVIKTLSLSKLVKGLVVGTDGLRELADDDLHHPALVQPKSLQRWLNAKTTERIHNGSFVSGKCSDDVSLVIVRTEEAQRRLTEERREVAELKQEILSLRTNFSTIQGELMTANLSRTDAESKVLSLQTELARLETKAEKVDLLTTGLTSLKVEIGKLSKNLPQKAAPVVTLFEEFWKKFLPTPTKKNRVGDNFADYYSKGKNRN
ncbi:MAG: protein phosphatase 2C domain-containing protein [Patescibacteria group bacterium]